MENDVQIIPLGDGALLIQYGNRIDDVLTKGYSTSIRNSATLGLLF
jgi:hypothetical protein